MAIRIQTILVDIFINVLVDELNNLEDKQVNDILIGEIDDKVPESENNIIENYSNSLQHFVTQIRQSSYLKWIMI